MKVDAFIDPKSRRKLIFDWQILANSSNYVIPESIEEYKKFDIWAPRIVINSTECFFNHKAKEVLRDFADTLYKCEHIRKIASYNLVYKTAISFIEQNIFNQVKHQVKTPPINYIEDILDAITSKCVQYQFIRVLDGLSLVGIKSISLGDVEIFIFDDSREIEMQKYRDVNNQNDFYVNIVTPFIKNNLLNKVCIKAATYGDADVAEEKADRKLKQAINIIRFIFCVYSYTRVYDRLAKINLLSESFNISERNLRVDQDNSIITLSGNSRKPLQSFDVDLKLLNELREYYFFNDWIDFISSENKTEIEKAILTSMYWTGEAQNDYIHESAFVKYWTALETFFSISEKNGAEAITEQLARGISCLLALGGYKFIEIDEIHVIYKRVKKLYKKRNKLIHRGIYEDINNEDLGEVCKYAVLCALTCIGLRSIGYSTLGQIKQQTNRLFNLRNRINS